MRRSIFMTESVALAVMGPWTDTALGRLCGSARALLEGFVAGDVIVGRMPPSKNVNTLIALLDQPAQNVWEFRIGSPRPGIRIFGRFAQQDTFVATNWDARAGLLDPKTRKDDPRKWRDAMIRCKREWVSLFPAYDPLSGKSLYDYISNSRYPV
jgi:hypothetical protein